MIDERAEEKKNQMENAEHAEKAAKQILLEEERAASLKASKSANKRETKESKKMAPLAESTNLVSRMTQRRHSNVVNPKATYPPNKHHD